MQDFHITRLGHLGDGIADGPVYAALTVPGDVVTGTLEGERLHDMRVKVPSDLRVSAQCRHFKSCGGCALQHVSADFVARWKEDVVKEALAAHGIEAPLRPVLTSPSHSRRRATFAAKRTKKGALVGFHGRASDTIVPVPDCVLVVPDLLQAFAVCEALAIQAGSRKGALAVSVTLTEGGLDLQVEGGKPLDGSLRAALGQMAETHKLARLTWADETIALRAPARVRFDGIAVEPPPGAFLQATEHGQEALIALVRDALGQPRRVLDLFAGCGTFALPLARTSEVHAVEGDRAMLQALDHGWRMSGGLKKVTTQMQDLFREPILAEDLNRFDAIVIDPPRAGAAAQIEQIAQSKVQTVAHVSCNPTTFARDAKVLISAGFALEWVQPVDQFRWSPHIELVGKFSR